MAAINSFEKNFSYFECLLPSGIYAGKYPVSQKYKSFDVPFKVGDKLFQIANSRSNITKINKYLKLLVQCDFGFLEMIGYLFPSSTDFDGMVLETLECHLRTLKIKEICKDDNVDLVEYYIKVNSDICQEEVKLFIRPQSLEQFATDVSLYYFDMNSIKGKTIDQINDGMKNKSIKIMTTLGYKRKSPTIMIGVTNVLSVCKFGCLYGAGEHIERDEVPIILDIIKQSVKKFPFSYDAKKITKRALDEELGMQVENESAYILGVDKRPRRDERYDENEYDGEIYGYKRLSTSTLISVFVASKIPQINEPADIEECSKAQPILFNDLCEEFRPDGAFPPAFISHVYQVKITRQLMPTILYDICQKHEFAEEVKNNLPDPVNDINTFLEQMLLTQPADFKSYIRRELIIIDQGFINMLARYFNNNNNIELFKSLFNTILDTKQSLEILRNIYVELMQYENIYMMHGKSIEKKYNFYIEAVKYIIENSDLNKILSAICPETFDGFVNIKKMIDKEGNRLVDIITTTTIKLKNSDANFKQKYEIIETHYEAWSKPVEETYEISYKKLAETIRIKLLHYFTYKTPCNDLLKMIVISRMDQIE
jgi:hypothetical protein